VKLSAVRTDEGRLLQTVGAQHENRRAAMFVDADCIVSKITSLQRLCVSNKNHQQFTLWKRQQSLTSYNGNISMLKTHAHRDQATSNRAGARQGKTADCRACCVKHYITTRQSL